MFVLFTDTDTDIMPEEAKKYGYNLISMPYIIDEKEIKPYEDFVEFDYHKFYESLREGVLPKTCAISPIAYENYFEPFLKEGKDILYVHFSKAMSGTFDAMNIAIEELKAKYPNNKIYTIDTFGITINSYIMVKCIGEMYKNGASLEEIMDFVNKEASHFATYFYADDLKFFARSGRVSNFSAIMGSIIGIKPIICMASDGMMKSISKGRGRIPTLAKIVEYVKELGDDIKSYPVIIGHTDALELAEKLGEMLKAELGDDLNISYVVVNPTAGSHCGPDAVGVAFHATCR